MYIPRNGILIKHVSKSSNRVSESYFLPCPLQDKFAELSQNRAKEAVKNGVFSEEIVPVKVTNRKVFS